MQLEVAKIQDNAGNLPRAQKKERETPSRLFEGIGP